ncbi:uncharacterized protein LOC133011109 [Limanda limanda]|uniref:uncharacterized protein LOC133011109 n=1 Tax=Limanda limanda TaxID=27771 RepID=UPI0029C76DA9|nr:uncharacterized protein LOC133011109 [Limanda limanda]
MWLKQSTLGLLTVAAMVVSGGQNVILDGEQRKVDVPFGSSLKLGCHLNTEVCTKPVKQSRLDWFFIPSGSIDNATININSSMEFNFTARWQDLPNVTQNNSGWYFCKVTVEIPCSKDIKSKGTQIAISNPEEPQAIPLWMWLLLGGLTFILIVLLFICVMLRRRCRRRRAEDQIYANTHPVANKQPSPRPSLPLDSLKTRSSTDDFWTPKSNRIYANGKWKQKN